MKTVCTRLAMAIVLLVWLPEGASAQYPFKRYADRKEGIINPTERVSGLKIDLIAALIRSEETAEAHKESPYAIRFCLADSSRISVVVQSFDDNYRMEPLNRDFSAGISSFQWPSTIPRHFGITPEGLFPFATWYASRQRNVAPIFVHQGEPVLSQPVYEFYYIAQKALKTLTYTVYGAESLEEIESGIAENIPPDALYPIRWDPMINDSTQAAPGTYQLVVTGTIEESSANTYEVTHKVSFYLCPEAP